MAECPAPGCRVRLTGPQVACAPHWLLVPASLRERLFEAWRDEPWSVAHWDALGAVYSVLERLPAPKPPRRRRLRRLYPGGPVIDG